MHFRATTWRNVYTYYIIGFIFALHLVAGRHTGIFLQNIFNLMEYYVLYYAQNMSWADPIHTHVKLNGLFSSILGYQILPSQTQFWTLQILNNNKKL